MIGGEEAEDEAETVARLRVMQRATAALAGPSWTVAEVLRSPPPSADGSTRAQRAWTSRVKHGGSVNWEVPPVEMVVSSPSIRALNVCVRVLRAPPADGALHALPPPLVEATIPLPELLSQHPVSVTLAPSTSKQGHSPANGGGTGGSASSGAASPDSGPGAALSGQLAAVHDRFFPWTTNRSGGDGGPVLTFGVTCVDADELVATVSGVEGAPARWGRHPLHWRACTVTGAGRHVAEARVEPQPGVKHPLAAPAPTVLRLPLTLGPAAVRVTLEAEGGDESEGKDGASSAAGRQLGATSGREGGAESDAEKGGVRPRAGRTLRWKSVRARGADMGAARVPSSGQRELARFVVQVSTSELTDESGSVRGCLRAPPSGVLTRGIPPPAASSLPPVQHPLPPVPRMELRPGEGRLALTHPLAKADPSARGAEELPKRSMRYKSLRALFGAGPRGTDSESRSSSASPTKRTAGAAGEEGEEGAAGAGRPGGAGATGGDAASLREEVGAVPPGASASGGVHAEGGSAEDGVRVHVEWRHVRHAPSAEAIQYRPTRDYSALDTTLSLCDAILAYVRLREPYLGRWGDRVRRIGFSKDAAVAEAEETIVFLRMFLRDLVWSMARQSMGRPMRNGRAAQVLLHVIAGLQTILGELSRSVGLRRGDRNAVEQAAVEADASLHDAQRAQRARMREGRGIVGRLRAFAAGVAQKDAVSEGAAVRMQLETCGQVIRGACEGINQLCAVLGDGRPLRACVSREEARDSASVEKQTEAENMVCEASARRGGGIAGAWACSRAYPAPRRSCARP